MCEWIHTRRRRIDARSYLPFCHERKRKKHEYAYEKGVHFNFNLLSFPSMHRMNSSPK